MSADDLNKNFKNWNPMESDYRNAEFNQYITGPGAGLDEELQPAQQAIRKNSGTGKVPTLIFKNVPESMTKNGLKNICSRHGLVKDVRDSTKNTFHFVDMATVGDMEAVLRALEHNNYGFKIIVGSNKDEKPSDKERNQSAQNVSFIPPKNTGIDYENRSYRTSQKNHPRPKVKEESFLNEGDVANTGLPLNLLTNDAHSLERQGLYKMANDNKFSYRHGRSYINMSEKTKQFIDKKHKESSGTYNETEHKYVHINENGTIPSNIAKCSQCYYSCDTMCGRCSQYYCSVECQKSDWPDHRYKCGKPKHLQKTPVSKKEVQTENISPKILQENTNRKTAPETRKEIEIKRISPKKIEKPSKIVPRQLQSVSKASSQPISTSSETLSQSSNSQKNVPKHLENSSKSSLQHPATSSKPSNKKLPAALRIISKQPANNSDKFSQQPLKNSDKFSQQPANNSDKFSQQPSTFPKASTQQVSNYSAASPSNFNDQPENSVESYKRNMPRSGNIVTITAISKINVVFIRSATYDDNLSYFNTVETLQSLGKLLKPLKTLPKSGEVVIAKFEDQFNRALVLNALDSKKILINLMDYGNMEHTKIEDLLEAPKEFIFKPRHAIPVVLKDVTEFYMTQEIRKFMHSYLNNINVEVRYKPEDYREYNNIFAVELIDENTQQNINKTIMKLSKPVQPQNSNEICDGDYLERKILPSGKNVEFIVMDNSLMCTGCISCTTKPYAIEINKFKKDIQAYVESIPNEAYTPRVNELCIARYNEDGLWYRGLCLETVGDGHPSIHFIDYGNITIVPIESIRRYPRQFTFPMYTFDCVIEGIPEHCNDTLIEKLEDLIPNGELIKCENVLADEESNFYILTLPNIIQELSDCGLLNVY